MIKEHVCYVWKLRSVSCPKNEAISGSTNRSSDRQNDNSTAELIRLHGSDTCTEGIVFTESHYWTDTATASADAAMTRPFQGLIATSGVPGKWGM